MLIFTVSTLLYSTLANALPTNIGLDFLDPILYQEHIQSPNGHYRYGYESNKAIAQQIHDSDGTSRGFYSYLDDQGRLQHVEYIAGHDGYKVLGNSGSPRVPVYTPEVEAARKAHLDAYLEAQKRALADQKAVAISKPMALENIKQTINTERPLTIDIPLRYKVNSIPNPAVQPQTIFVEPRINLFSGQPIKPIYQNSFLHSSLQNTFPATTPKPFQDSTVPNVDNKVFILPPPKVHHYEKIWPLRPLRYINLEVQINGQNLYDPKTNYLNRNVDYSSRSTELPQNIFVPQYTTPQSLNYNGNVFSIPTHEDISQSIVQPSNFPSHVATYQNENIQQISSPVVSEMQHFPQPITSGLTAHQIDFINHQQGYLTENFAPDAAVVKQNNTKPADNSVSKIIVTKSNVSVEKNIAAPAAKKAFDILKEKYNLS